MKLINIFKEHPQGDLDAIEEADAIILIISPDMLLAKVFFFFSLVICSFFVFSVDLFYFIYLLYCILFYFILLQHVNRELDLAFKYNKRIIPVVYRDVDPLAVRLDVGLLNWIFLREDDDFEGHTKLLRRYIDAGLFL
jgi:hypothetical protein